MTRLYEYTPVRKLSLFDCIFQVVYGNSFIVALGVNICVTERIAIKVETFYDFHFNCYKYSCYKRRTVGLHVAPKLKCCTGENSPPIS